MRSSLAQPRMTWEAKFVEWNSMSTTFILTDSLANNASGSYMHYEHRSLNANHWTFCDIREITHRCQERWVNQIITWHQTLNNIGSDLDWQWWLLPASRVAFLTPIEFKPLFFALGVLEYVRSNSLEVLFLVGVPEEVKQYLQEWCVQSGRDSKSVVIDYCSRQPISLYNKLAYSVRPLLKVAFHFCVLAKKIFLCRTLRNTTNSIKTLVFSLTLTKEIITSRGDHFFGRVFDGAEEKNSSDTTQWFYYLTQFGDKEAINKYCHSIGRNIYFEFQWLRWTDIIRIAGDVVRLYFRFRRFEHRVPLLSIDNLKSSAFAKRFVLEAVSNYVPILELAIYRAMKNCLRSTSPQVVIYPFEQKGLERAILRACAEHSQAIQTIAFAHALYNKQHWYICDYNVGKRPMPSFIAVTGSAALLWMMERTKWPESHFLLFGSPRALFTPKLPYRTRSSSLRVLMVVGYSYEIEHLATWVEMQPTLFSECELMVRRYPYAAKASQDQALQRLSDLGVQVLKDTGSLEEQVAWADVILFCASSAGVEAMLMGRLVIRVNLDDVLNTDPIGGKPEAHVVPYCSTPEELKCLLSQIALDPSEYYAVRSKVQQQFAEGIYMRVNNQQPLASLSFEEGRDKRFEIN